jgi:Fe-S-cluster containining protein
MSNPANPGSTSGGAITCATCRACCCKLEVILMGDDDPPAEFVAIDQWGGQVMKRLDDGWCAAVDRVTMLCRIYERRPGVCREFAVGESECLTERLALDEEKRIVLMDECPTRC